MHIGYIKDTEPGHFLSYHVSNNILSEVSEDRFDWLIQYAMYNRVQGGQWGFYPRYNRNKDRN